jgi:uncharacterized protein (TIGR02246 family)
MISKNLVVTVGLTALLAAGAAVAAKDAAPVPEKELRAAVDQFAAGWNHADAKAMAAVFTEDASLVNPFGRGAEGRAGIEKFFAEELATMTKGTTFTVKGFSARLLNPVALEDIEIEIAGGALAPDPARPARHHAFVVARKQAGSWLIVTLRAYSILPPPQPPAK